MLGRLALRFNSNTVRTVAAVLLIGVVLSAGVVGIRVKDSWPTWTGFGSSTVEQHSVETTEPRTGAKTTFVTQIQPGKTLWDWLDLFLVPALLFLGGIWFTQQEKRTEQQSTEHRAQADALQNYLDHMSTLLLERPLGSSASNAKVYQVARARTLTALRRLDKYSQVTVLRFLVDTGLVDEAKPLINFCGADLRGYDLKGTNLSRTNLTGADLEGVHLGESNLGHAVLRSANLAYAHLRRADLRSAKLDRSALWAADLRHASMEESSLADALLSKALLQGAHLDSVDAPGARFDGARMRGADLRGANLQRTNFSNVKLAGVRLEGVTFESANLLGADLSGALLGNGRVNLKNVLYNARTRWPKDFAPPYGVITGNLDLSRRELQRTHLEEANLSAADLRSAVLDHSRLDDATLRDARLERASLRDTWLLRADLQNAKLTNVHAEGAHFNDANMKGTDLTRAHLDGADLRGVKHLTQAQLDQAASYVEAKLPAYLSTGGSAHMQISDS